LSLLFLIVAVTCNDIAEAYPLLWRKTALAHINSRKRHASTHTFRTHLKFTLREPKCIVYKNEQSTKNEDI
jgi:hypothetical protein